MVSEPLDEAHAQHNDRCSHRGNDQQDAAQGPEHVGETRLSAHGAGDDSDQPEGDDGGEERDGRVDEMPPEQTRQAQEDADDTGGRDPLRLEVSHLNRQREHDQSRGSGIRVSPEAGYP